MKVCVFGAGAVGGHIAAKLAAAGADETSVVARGAQLAAIRDKGIVVRSGGKEIRGRPAHATDDPSQLARQDIVLVTLKAPALTAAAGAIARLVAPGGTAVFLMNGIPWWWRYGLPGAAATLPLLDPDAALWREVTPQRTVGGVIYSPNDLVEPGVIVHTGPHRFILGEPDGSKSARLETVQAVFARAGMENVASTDLRRDIWEKLFLNASGNTLTALTRLDLGGIGADPGLIELSKAIMRETLETAAALGWDIRAGKDLDALARRGLPGQRPSMLQDVLGGRPMEVEALLGQVQAFARETGVATPSIDAILPVLRGLDRSLRSARGA